MSNISLKKIALEDVKIMAKYANNYNIWLKLTDSFPHPYSEKDAKEFIEKVINQKPTQTFKITKNNEFIGVITISPQKGIYHKNAEIGYWIAESFWGQGIGTQAVNLVVEYGFHTFSEIGKIIAKVFDTNVGSMRILEKNGFKKEAIIKKEAFKANEFIDIHYFYIFRN